MQRRDLGPSVEIKPRWDVVIELEFPKLSKPQLEVEKPQDVHLAGEVHYFNPELDSVRPRTAKRLHIPPKTTRHISTTASSDPIMKSYMDKGVANVFITDDVLACIMVAARSFYSWDITVTKEGDRIVFDKRPKSRLGTLTPIFFYFILFFLWEGGSNTLLHALTMLMFVRVCVGGGTADYLTVNENGPNPHFSQDPRHPNHQLKLNTEATFVNQHFQEQCWSPKTASMGNPDPVGSAQHRVGYRYRLWDLEDDVKMLVRCTHDALVQSKKSKYFASVCSINEWYPDLNQNSGWRHRLETQVCFPSSTLIVYVCVHVCTCVRALEHVCLLTGFFPNVLVLSRKVPCGQRRSRTTRARSPAGSFRPCLLATVK